MRTQTDLLPRWAIAAMSVVLLCLLAGGTMFYRAEERTARQSASAELLAISRLKVDQISAWRQDQLADAGRLTDSPFLAATVAQYLATPGGGPEEALRDRLGSLEQEHDFASALLVDTQGHVRLSLGWKGSLPSCAAAATAKALRDGTPVLTDLQTDPEHPAPHLSVVAPVLDRTVTPPRPLGAILLVNEAAQFLYPLIQSWPTPSPTAETLLVRRDGDAVLFLNNLRRQSGAALHLRIPLDKTDVPSVMAVLGRTGVVEGTDYRGVPVVSVLERVPDSPWFMVAKVDAEEVFANWHTQARLILLALAALVSAILAIGLLAWQRGAQQHYAALYQSESALRESVDMLNEAERIAELGSYVLDMRSGFWRSSETLDSIFGIGPEYIRPVQGWAELIHPDDHEMMVDHFTREVVRELKLFNKDYRIIRHGDRAERWVHGSGRLDLDVNGTPIRMHGTIQDITARKEAEAEQDRLQSQLVHAQKMESVGRLAGGVAHDFNNMLSAILGYTELALGRLQPSDPLHADLLEVQAAARRSADLTRQLLGFARKQTIAPRAIDLNETIEGLLKMLRPLIGEAIELVWHPGKGLWSINMDPSQISQILANLCANARDAIRGVGRITLETGHATINEEYCAGHAGFVPGELVRLTVTDSGAGMEREVLDHLFEPFFTTKRIGAGTGLGLATVYGIVKQNHGFINVYSEPGHGTTFQIYVPRYRGTADERAADEPATPATGGHETVLLVEDEPTVLRMAGAALTGLGYDVLTAGSPAEAIRVADEHTGPIDLLLTDVVMPGMNGRDLAARLQSGRQALACVFMSGYPANVIAHQGVLAEGVVFIQKPFSMAALAAKLREALAASPTASCAPFRIRR